jgi:hypothetical protein
MSLSVTASVASGKAPLTVSFSVSGMSGVYCDLWWWDFGDGQTSSEINPTHVYASAGTFIATFTAFGGSSGYCCCSCCCCCGCAGVSAKVSASTTITVGQALDIYRLDKCYRVGLGGSQEGVGPSEYSGNYWIQAAVACGGVEVVDTKGQTRQVLFDNRTGSWREIGEIAGPTGSGLALQWVDDGPDGAEHEISGSIELPEVSGETELFRILALEARLGLRPYDEATKRGVTGYDANGFRNAQQIDIGLRLDGDDADTLYTEDVLDESEANFAREISARRARMIVRFAASEFVFLSALQNYKVSDIKDGPLLVSTAEMGYSALLSDLSVWFTRGGELFRDKIGQGLITGVSRVGAGPDGNSDSAIIPDGGNSVASVALTGGMILLWTYGAITAQIGGAPIALSTFAVFGDWSLKYAIVTATGWLIIYGEGAQRFFDLRVYATALAITATRSPVAMLYDDLVNNSGKNTLNPA